MHRMHGGPHEGGWMRGGLQLGPPGRWWDDEAFAADLGLSRDQRQRMDAIFEQNRAPLVAGYRSLHQEELQMEAITRAKVVDETALDAEIDRIAQARAALEKANSHMLLLIRREMTPEQIARLDSRRP
jgi:Spy/CpxP family protein refolding chaperone